MSKRALVTFMQLPVGESFQWVIPPRLRNGHSLDGVFVKGAPNTFGDTIETHNQIAEVSPHEMSDLVLPVSGRVAV